MIKKYTLDMLNENSVSVKTQDYVVSEEVEYAVNQPHRKAYVNSVMGRNEVIAELPEMYQNSIFAIWGEEPTIFEEVVE